MIEAAGLGKSFDGAMAIEDVGFAAAAGECVAIIGPSGCGKSTLLRCLNYLEIPDRGSVRVGETRLVRDGRAPDRAAAHRLRAQVGMVFQGFQLFAHRSVIDNVMLAPRVVKRLSREVARAEAEALLAQVGLAGFAHRLPHTLSGGQQQRAAIARALAMRPRVMLYDEPTSALDPELVQEVLQVMRDLDAGGMTQIVVTHELRFAASAADRIIYMEAGRIVEQGAPGIVLRAPADPRTRRFVERAG